MVILLPKFLPNLNLEYGPPFFLAGPVSGGDDWQAVCCAKIYQRMKDFYAAIPCRYPTDHPLRQFERTDLRATKRQLDWENHYLNLAATKGCLIFWLPLESRTNPRTLPGPYAMDTMRELGAWSAHLHYRPKLRIVIGAHPDFPGLSQHQREFSRAVGYEFPIYDTMEETVEAAITKATAR